MSLGISASDVLQYLGQIFTAIWPVLAIGLGIMAAPMVIRAAKSAFGYGEDDYDEYDD